MQSRDRVKFTLSSNMLAKAGMSVLLNEIFGITQRQINDHCDPYDGITIICRPSQFARFLIIRNDREMPNSFKELNPKLFIPKAEKRRQPIDASGNPHRPIECEN